MKKRVAVVLFVAQAACSSSGSRATFDDPTADGGTIDPGGSLGDAGPGDGGGTTDAGALLLYVHTDTALYQLDPNKIAAAPQLVGDFDCIGKGKAAPTMTDLAVTSDGKLYGVSEGSAFPLTIQSGGVHCESTWSLPSTKFYGLSVAPVNTLAPTEVLVAADGAGGLYQIDATSGNPTQTGTLGTDPISNKPWSLSGDIVFLANNGSPLGFATVRTCTNGSSCSPNDTLIELDMTKLKPGTQSTLKSVRGEVKKGAWCTNSASPAAFGSMFGIVAYQDKVFGFSRAGEVVEIDNTDGTACLISANSSLKFAGAGVSTAIPVVPPVVN